MKKLKFSKIIFITLGILVLILIILTVLNTISNAHIRFIEVDGGKDNAEFSQQRIKVYFNRPIQRTVNNKPVDFKQFINLEPSTDFNITWNGNTLYIIPKETLNEDQEYKVTIHPGFKDVYGNTVENSFDYNFRTKPLNLAYLEKNYPKSKDKIIVKNIKNTESNIIVEDENIKQYTINKDYLVYVVTNNDLTDNIKIINLNNYSRKDLKFQNYSVSKVDLSYTLNAFIYIFQEVDPKEQYLQPLSNNKIQIYNLNDSTTSTFDPKGTATDLMDANFSPDGKSILYRSIDSLYFLAPINNSTDPISIGKFTGTGGFNKDGTEIIFTSYDPSVTYSSYPFIAIFTTDRKTITITNPNTYVLDPVFFNKSANIVFSEKTKDLLGAQGFFKIVEGLRNEAKDIKYDFKDLLSDNSKSLELPKISWDDKYIVAERYNENALLDYRNQRSFINQRKPYVADLVILDLETRELITEIPNGIDAKWLR